MIKQLSASRFMRRVRLARERQTVGAALATIAAFLFIVILTFGGFAK